MSWKPLSPSPRCSLVLLAFAASLLLGPVGLTAQAVCAPAGQPPMVMARRVEHLYDGRAFPLVHVVAGAVLPDGSAVILDRNGSPFLRVIGPDGSERASWGMRGDGPSELRVPEGLSVLGDTALAVWDVGARRLTTFDLDGEVLRTDSHPHVDQWGYRFVGARTDGSWIEQAALSTSELKGTPDGTRHDSVSFYVHPRGGSGRRLLLRVAGPMRQFFTHKTGVYSNMRPIFARDVVASMVGDTLLVGTTDSATFQVRSVGRTRPPSLRSFSGPPGRQ